MTTSTYNSQGSANKGFILVIVALCLAGAALVAFVAAGSGGDDPDAVAQTAEVTIEGELLPQMGNVNGLTNSSNDPAIGMVAATVIGTDFQGNEVRIEPDGRPKAVYFLAHWCQFCQDEVPAVQSLIDSGAQPEGMDIYGVATSTNSGQGNYPPLRWLQAEGFTPPVMRDSDNSEALINYGAGGFPYVVYLDGDNTVLARSSGSLDESTIAAAWQLTAGGVPAQG